MCNVHEEDVQPVAKKSLSIGRKCMKCDASAVALARTKDPFCRICFFAYITHRFRSTVGKSRLVQHGEKVLLAFSGGYSSRVMLDLVEEGLSDRVKKRLRFVPSVIYIDEGAVLGQTLVERCQNTAEIISISRQCGFPVHITLLEQVLNTEYPLVYTLFERKELEPKEGSVDRGEEGDAERTVPLSMVVPNQASDFAALKDKQGGVELDPLTSTAIGDEQGGDKLGPLTSTAIGDKQGGVELDPLTSTAIGDEQGGIELDPLTSTAFRDKRGGIELDSLTSTTTGGNLFSLPTLPLTDDKVPTSRDEVRDPISLEKLNQKLMEAMDKRDVQLERKIIKLFEETKSSSAKENLLLSLRHKLLVEIARSTGCTKVLVGDNATRLSVRLLGNIAQGRGATLPLDTGFADDRAVDVVVIRPLREFPSREMAMCVALNNLSTVFTPSLNMLGSGKTSIETLTESFISGLQANFPSTVNTIFRTGDKLTVSREEDEHVSCALCQAPLGQLGDVTQVFTHLLLPDSVLQQSSEAKEVWENLCYGCRLTVKDMKYDLSALPLSVHEATPVARERMKAQVDDFLLKDQ